MLWRRLLFFSCLLGLTACSEEDSSGPPEIAGVWLLCSDDTCKDTQPIGWYFPGDHNAVQRVLVTDGKMCAEVKPLFEGSSWEETAEGTVILHDLRGVGDYEFERHGDLLDSLSDAFAFGDPPSRYMTRVASAPDPC